MDIDSFYDTLENYFQYICGYGCVGTAIEFSKLLGNFDANFIKASYKWRY